MSISDSKTRTVITLEKSLKADIENLAQENDRSFNNQVIRILKEYMDTIKENPNK